jgi:hypothetical protein
MAGRGRQRGGKGHGAVLALCAVTARQQSDCAQGKGREIDEEKGVHRGRMKRMMDKTATDGGLL